MFPFWIMSLCNLQSCAGTSTAILLRYSSRKWRTACDVLTILQQIILTITVLRQFLFLKGKLSPPPSALPLPAPKNFYLNGCEWWKNCNFWWWYCPYYSLRFALIKRQCSLASEFRSVSSAKNMKIYQNNLSKQCS